MDSSQDEENAGTTAGNDQGSEVHSQQGLEVNDSTQGLVHKQRGSAWVLKTVLDLFPAVLPGVSQVKL